MKCPVCHTKLSKKTEMCPNCGQRVEVSTCIVTPIGEISKDLLKKFGLAFWVFACFVIGLVLHPYLWVGNNNIYDRNTLESVLKKGAAMLDEESVSLMIESRDDLKRLLAKQGYQDIEIEENVQVEDYIYRGSSFTITASNNLHDIKITYINNVYHEVTKSYAVAGSGESQNRQFEISRSDVFGIFEYLGFDEGYHALTSGYDKMTQTSQTQYRYIANDDYNIMMNNEINRSMYKYSYTITK